MYGSLTSNSPDNVSSPNIGKTISNSVGLKRADKYDAMTPTTIVIEIDKSEGILSMTSALQIAGNSKNMINATLMTPNV